jgi:hypothetical protein
MQNIVSKVIYLAYVRFDIRFENLDQLVTVSNQENLDDLLTMSNKFNTNKLQDLLP